MTTRVTLALILGLVTGIVVRSSALSAALEPIGTLWLNAVRMPVIPLVACLLIASVAGAPDTRQVRGLTVRAILFFAAVTTVLVLIALLAGPLLLSPIQLDPSATAALRESAKIDATSAQSASLKNWLTTLIPANPIRAAAEGALLPMIVFSLLYAAGARTLNPEARQRQVRFFDGVASALLGVVRWVVWAAPVGVFALSVTLGTQLGGAALRAAAYYIAVLTGLVAGLGVLLYPVTAVLAGVPLGLLARTLLPAQAVTFSARSSVAGLPVLIANVRAQLPLPETVVGYILPLSAGLFKITAGLAWPIGAFFVAKLYGLTLSPAQLATFALGTLILSFSIPGIPSGGFLVQAPLYAATGLPLEGLGVLIALDAIPDMFKGVSNLTGYLTTAAALGRRAAPEVGRETAAHPSG